MDSSEVLDTDPKEEADDHWEHDDIVLMLSLYLENVDKFRTPKVKKKNVWTEIAEPIGKHPDMCDKKFRNLKQTYVRLLKRKLSNPSSFETKWPYFDLFQEIYSANGDYQPEILQRLQENPNESVTKILKSFDEAEKYETQVPEIDETQNNQKRGVKRKLVSKRYADFKNLSVELRQRQRNVEEKLNKLIQIVEESNEIQRERNILFVQFLEKFNPNT